nr:hypothetical protein [Tanacetum cinerariifolium]
MLDSQISTKVKTGLGYDSQFNEKEVLVVKEKEVTKTVFDNRSSDKENSLANDRFKKGEGNHTVPPYLVGNYMPPKSDLSFAGLDDSIYNFKISETVTSLTKDEKEAPETSIACVEKPKEDRSSAPLIQDWDTDSDNDSVFRSEHIAAKIDFVKADRMAKKYVLPNNVRKGTGHKESRPVWNNVQKNKSSKQLCSNSSIHKGHPQQALKNKGIVDSGYSRHMTGKKTYLADYQEINDGGFVAFGSSRGGDSLVRAATTTSLDAQQDCSNITKTQSKATLNEPTPQGEGSGSGIGRQETMGAQTPHDSPLSEGYIPGSDEGSISLKELTNLCTTLLQKVLDMKNVKTAQEKEIASMKKRVTKLEQGQSSRFLGFHPFRADVLDEDADTKVIVEDQGNGEKGGSTTKTVSTARPDISAARSEVSTTKPKTPPTTTTLFDDEDVIIADTLVKMKNQKAKEKGIAFKDADDSTRPIVSLEKSNKNVIGLRISISYQSMSV